MNTNLANRWVVISGASSGFGAAAARLFAAQKAHLLLGARRMERLDGVIEEALAAGAASAQAHFLDVTQAQSVESFGQWVSTATSCVDVLINNAGGAHGLDTVASGRDADWEAMVQSNFLGLLRVTRALLPLMTLHPGGTILNVGSIAGHTAYEGGSVYCGCKAAELQITRALRLELCGTGLRVCSIDPGMAETEFSLVRFKGDTTRASQVYAGVHPLTANDVAETMLWIATRPPHVCIDDIIIKPTDQAAVHKVHRRPA